jgi:lipoprotein-releasing system permease protein
MNKLEWWLAFKYLISQRKEGFISVVAFFSFLGILLGVATLIIVMAVMNGFRIELVDRILGINAHIVISAPDNRISNYSEKVAQIKKITNVKLVSPYVYGQVLAVSGKVHSGAIVRGMRVDDLKQKPLVSEKIAEGEISNSGVLIGINMAREMGLKVGQQIRLISPDSTSTFLGQMPRLKDYYISGIFDVGMAEYDSSTIFMPMQLAQIYFKTGESVNNIEIYAEDLKKLDDIKGELYKIFPELGITDWLQANQNFVHSLKVESNVMFLILTLIIIVAAFNIISGMVMLVNSKQKEIAILRTFGASKTRILRIFLICGSMIGFSGTLLGFITGLSISLNIESIRKWLEGISGTELFSSEVFYLTQLPAKVEAGDVTMVVCMSLFLTILATLYPAWRASKISPAEALRYE